MLGVWIYREFRIIPCMSGKRMANICGKMRAYSLVMFGENVEIQKLTVSERIMLAEALWDSVIDQETDIDLTDEQKNELDRRLSAFELDGDDGAEWSAIKARIVSK